MVIARTIGRVASAAGICMVMLVGSLRAQPEAMPLTVLSNEPYPATPASPTITRAISPEPTPECVPSVLPGNATPGLTDMLDPSATVPPPSNWQGPYSFELLPDGLMYKDYLAGQEEPRFASQWIHDKKLGGLWDVSLGGHVGLIRYGTQDPLNPEGYQLDIEGVALPRLDSARNMVSTDFRAGIPFTVRDGPWEAKFGYYHLSSHVGDIYLLAHPGFTRINYVREAIVLGAAYHPFADVRIYGEANWAFHIDGDAAPWEFQFGIEYSSQQPTGAEGSPFLAVNGVLREDVDYDGNVTAEAGWQWRGASGHLFRVGAIYFNGKSDQRQFYRDNENYIGGGLWYDY